MKSGDGWKLLLVLLALGAGAGGVGYAAATAERRQKTRRTLREFVGRAWEFEQRFQRAVVGRWHRWVSPGAAHTRLAHTNPAQVLRHAVASIHQRVRWTRDEVTCGTLHCWNAVDETWLHGRGDCKAMATLLVKWLGDAGLFGFRVVVGTVNGDGHAWVESADSAVFLDPTAGTLFSGRPVAYAPAVMLGGSHPVVMAAA
jgi:hypothetical protein